MSIPLQIYDFIALLFPSVVSLTLIRFELPHISIWEMSVSYGGLAVTLVFTYIWGQLLTTLANKIEKNSYTNWILYRRGPKIGQQQIGLSGRKFPVVLNEKVGKEILKCLSEFYGFPVQANESGLFELVYAPVSDKMAKRDLFLSIANMMRQLVVIAFIYGVYTLYEIVSQLFLGKFLTSQLIILCIVLVFYFVCLESYRNNTKYAESIPYTAFLSWYKGQKK